MYNIIVKKIFLYFSLLRFNRPIGIWLLIFPSLTSLFIAKNSFPTIINIIKIIFFTIYIRSLGCLINDIIDYKLDRKVKRTKLRPIANNDITRNEAIIFFCILCIILFFILFLLLDIKTIFISMIFGIIILIYPLSKYIFFLPQIILSIAFNAFIPIIFSIEKQFYFSNYKMLFLYFINLLWVFYYDSIYSLLDQKYDLSYEERIIYSSSIFFMYNINSVLFFLNIMINILWLIFFILLSYKKISFIFFLLYVIYSIYQIVLIKRMKYYNAFLTCNIMNIIIFLGTIINYVL